ncbi:DUF1524 domain-containing protein [Gordonia sp. SID5947]|uniref:GmrSD restriction endonuclease domain-containing protein n=1 Tax=Gordonia sp. SID5947 TaxID=2690315 RepID=UPI00136F9F56|nr:DUF1524 domain-containing protein [Gordonia sp. SID5947]MYR08554.1 DUF1524 domain-containing protein [Gordonia sp. SID5947]
MNSQPKSGVSRTWWTALGAVVVVAAALIAAGVVGGSDESEPVAKTATTSTPAVASTTTSSTEPTLQPVAATAATTVSANAADGSLAKLETLAVKGRAPKTGYSRDQFGQSWTDDVSVAGGHNGCDTRNDILRRDLTAITVKPGSNGCAVQTGTLDDPYTGATIAFQRGVRTSSAVQIDHVVALSDAWQKGAQQLSALERRNFANDPRNLQAADGPANQQKGDGDAATWLPSNKSYRCAYVSRQIDVKALYRLWVTQAEKDAMVRILGSCGGTPVATTSQMPEPSETATRTATPAPAYTPPPTTTQPEYVAPPAAPEGGSAYYANCSAVRAAGAAPIHAGEPGYRSGLDRDGDGVGCE